MGLRRWNGPAVKRKMQMASVIGINRTMAEAVGEAKMDHPWQNRTGTLERGTRIVQPASIKGRVISGLWGVALVLYGKYLERSRKWRWLAPAARVTYPRLAAHIKAAL